MNIWRISTIFTSFFLLSSISIAQNFKFLNEDITIAANSVNFNNNTSIHTAEGDVIITAGDAILRCEKALINKDTGEFYADGKVTLQQLLNYVHSDKIVGNFRTGAFETDKYIIKRDALYAISSNAKRYASEAFLTDPKEKDLAESTQMKNVAFSTCDYLHHGNAHYSVSAKKVIIKPNGYFKAYNVTLKVNDIPVLWLPTFWTKDTAGVGLDYQLGYSSHFGAFVKLVAPMQINDQIKNEVLVDLFSKRGLALGDRLSIKTNNSSTSFLVYGIKDSDSPNTDEIVPRNPADGIEHNEYNRRFKVTDDRYRLKLDHHTQLTKNIAIDAKIDKLSDIDMLEDWFRKEYRNIFQPTTDASINYLSENIHSYLNVRPRVNDFYSVVERLPEFHVDFFRQEIGDTNIFYQGHFNIANLKMRWRKADRNRPFDSATNQYLDDLENYDSLRMDTLHSIYYPMQYKNFLNIIPRAGVRLTHYSNSSARKLSINELNDNFNVADSDNVTGTEKVTNYDDRGDALWRITGEVGLELSYKTFKTWNNYNNERFRLDGFRHVIEPYINFTSVFKPTEDKENIYYFDEIDRIDKLNFARIGAKQRFQTRRNNEICTFATIENYVDLHATTRDDINTLGDFGSYLEFNPKENVSLWARTLVSMDNANINEFELGSEFSVTKNIDMSIAYLYRDDYQAAPVYSMNSYLADFGSSAFFEKRFERAHSLDIAFMFPINDKTRARLRYVFDLVDAKLVEQYYELHRDLHCWTGALQLGIDDGDVKVMLMLYLKALQNNRIFSDDGYFSAK